MKTVTQKDLQDLYASPDYEQTEAMRRTLANLQEKAAPERRPVVMKRRVAFVLAAVLALAGIAAVGAGIYSRAVVSWGGEIRENEHAEEDAVNMDTAERLFAALADIPEDVCAAITTADLSETAFTTVHRTVSSAEELARLLDEAGYAHPAVLVPEGWTFRDGEADYECSPEGKYELISKDSRDGMELEQYRLDEQYRVLRGYSVRLEKDGREAVYTSGITFMTDVDLGYPSREGLEAEVLSVPGMTDALLTRYGANVYLMMYRRLDKPVLLMAGPYAQEPDECTWEDISSEGLEPEEFLPLFTEAK